MSRINIAGIYKNEGLKFELNYPKIKHKIKEKVEDQKYNFA